jgi:signal transduction histidine kinase
MRRAPIRIRSFILGTVLVLLLVPTLAGGAAWLIEHDHQQADIQSRLDTAVAYLEAHHAERKGSIQGFTSLLDRLDLLAQVVVAGPNTKSLLYVSPALNLLAQKKQAAAGPTNSGQTGLPSTGTPVGTGAASWTADHRLLPVGTRKSGATLAIDLYYRPASRTTRALVALITGILVLLAGLAVMVWLAGRWMVNPLTRLSAQVDKVAGGDLAIAVPHSRVGEIANIAQALEGMTAALGESAQQRAKADEARQFLVTSIAHDLRTPLFALRGHLQAIGSRLGNPAIHLQRAEARADALERLIGNLFAYTRNDYTQPALQLEAVPVAELLQEVTTGLEHAARLRDNTFVLDGDQTVAVTVDHDRIKRALTNILDNALRHSPTDTPVHLTWTADDEASVEITVRDHGPGIDPDLLPHIFEPGIRGTSTSGNPGEGAGLGLAIAKRLLEHQHATITARNQPNGGAVLSITLKRTRPGDRSMSSPQAKNHGALVEQSGRKRWQPPANAATEETARTRRSATARNPLQPPEP